MSTAKHEAHADDVSCDDCETCPACSSHDDLCCGNDDGCLAEQPDICVSHDPRDNREGDPTLNGAFA